MGEPSDWAWEMMERLYGACTCEDPLVGAAADNCDKCIARMFDECRKIGREEAEKEKS